MNIASVSPYYVLCRSISKFAGIFTIVVGFLVLLGWQFDISFFKSIIPNYVSMNPMTAVCFLLSGSSLLFHHSSYNSQRYSIATTAVLLVFLIAAVRLAVIFFGFNNSPDQFLFVSKVGTNHMAPNTAFNFIILSICQLTLRYPRNPLRHFLVLLAMTISFMAIVGYFYNIQALYQIPAYISMALNTAITFFILSIGILCLDLDYGCMCIMTNEGVSGAMFRRLLPQSICVLIGLGWLRLMSARLKYVDVEFGILIFVISLVVIFVCLIWYAACIMEKVDIERQRKSKELDEARISALKIAQEAQGARKKVIESNEELIRFNNMAVDREMRMIELKKKINELSKQLNLKEPYDLSFLKEKK